MIVATALMLSVLQVVRCVLLREAGPSGMIVVQKLGETGKLVIRRFRHLTGPRNIDQANAMQSVYKAYNHPSREE